jgi:asparagine synthase (glutamine-hydrolysing)
MSWIAGTFAAGGHQDDARLAELSRDSGGAVVGQGPLRVWLARPALAREGPLCLINGRIDNARSIARELGHEREQQNSIEELLIAGYRRWGPELLGRLRGEFALLLWDEQRGEGLIARDQLGVESVFVSESGGCLRFAGEIHHLLRLLPTRPAPDPLGVAHWISVSGREGPQTLYEGIRRLQPGSVLILDRSRAREDRYWAPRFAEPFGRSGSGTPGRSGSGTLGRSGSGALERVRSSLDLAVARRVDADGPTGVLMSGGLDSASVAALAAELTPGTVRGYSGVFPEHPNVDETELISELRERLRLGGITVSVRSGGLISSALESLAACELPLVAWGDFWTLPLLRAAAADGVAVSLGGDGGDELFGARGHLLADRLRSGRLLRAYELARELPGAGDKPARREVASVLRELAVMGALPYRAHRALGALQREPAGLLRAPFARALRASRAPLAWKRLDGPRWWAQLAYGLTQGIEQTGVFEHQRLRGAMAGVRARHPLFDLDLVELSLRLDPESTFDRYRSRPTLRAAMAGSLPESVRMRPAKAWFDSLIVDCLSGADRPVVERLLDAPDSQVRAYVESGELRRTLLEVDPATSANRFGWMHQTWRLVTIECWLRRQADPDGAILPEDSKPSSARLRMAAQPRPAEDANRA